MSRPSIIPDYDDWKRNEMTTPSTKIAESMLDARIECKARLEQSRFVHAQSHERVRQAERVLRAAKDRLSDTRRDLEKVTIEWNNLNAASYEMQRLERKSNAT